MECRSGDAAGGDWGGGGGGGGGATLCVCSLCWGWGRL